MRDVPDGDLGEVSDSGYRVYLTPDGHRIDNPELGGPGFKDLMERLYPTYTLNNPTWLAFFREHPGHPAGLPDRMGGASRYQYEGRDPYRWDSWHQCEVTIPHWVEDPSPELLRASCWPGLKETNG